MQRLAAKKLTRFCLALALINVSTLAIASDFNLPFTNVSGLGDLYSGSAASAEDASTAYSNPAGLVKIPNQQLVLGGIAIFNNSRFNGTTTPPFPPAPPQTGSAKTRLDVLFPVFYYAAPITDRVVVGVSENYPFAVGANYSKYSIVRYSATTDRIIAVDVGPSVGVKITDKFSAGLGLDFERLVMTFNNMVALPFSPDGESQNHLAGWGYGWHGGLLYQFTPATRAGINYNSPVMFHTTGDSEFYGPPAFGGVSRTTNQKSNLALPALAQASINQDINPQWTVKGTIFYTNWASLNQITLKRVALPGGATISSTVPLNYHNTFDYAVGVNYKPTTKWILRAGFELLNTPTNDRNRLVADPIGAAPVLAIGAHYQQNRNIGYDVGYAHPFFYQTKYSNISPTTSVFGYSNSQSNELGLQVTWNFV